MALIATSPLRSTLIITRRSPSALAKSNHYKLCPSYVGVQLSHGVVFFIAELAGLKIVPVGDAAALFDMD